jgi:hypothetical protein
MQNKNIFLFFVLHFCIFWSPPCLWLVEIIFWTNQGWLEWRAGKRTQAVTPHRLPENLFPHSTVASESEKKPTDVDALKKYMLFYWYIFMAPTTVVFFSDSGATVECGNKFPGRRCDVCKRTWIQIVLGRTQKIPNFEPAIPWKMQTRTFQIPLIDESNPQKLN